MVINQVYNDGSKTLIYTNHWLVWFEAKKTAPVFGASQDQVQVQVMECISVSILEDDIWEWICTLVGLHRCTAGLQIRQSIWERSFDCQTFQLKDDDLLLLKYALAYDSYFYLLFSIANSQLKVQADGKCQVESSGNKKYAPQEMSETGKCFIFVYYKQYLICEIRIIILKLYRCILLTHAHKVMGYADIYTKSYKLCTKLWESNRSDIHIMAVIHVAALLSLLKWWSSPETAFIIVLSSCIFKLFFLSSCWYCVAAETKVLFTYEVEWQESNVRWASRWDTYLAMSDVQIHWFSIINSVVVVLFLAGK